MTGKVFVSSVHKGVRGQKFENQDSVTGRSEMNDENRITPDLVGFASA